MYVLIERFIVFFKLILSVLNIFKSAKIMIIRLGLGILIIKLQLIINLTFNQLLKYFLSLNIYEKDDFHL